jgi:hypothetical protein
MINETLQLTQTNNSAIYHVTDILANATVELLKTNNTWLVFFAVMGICGVMYAIGKYGIKSLEYLFMATIAIPLIIIFGIINKKHRRERLEELGQMRSYLKDNPDKLKNIIFYIVIGLIPLFLIIVVRVLI